MEKSMRRKAYAKITLALHAIKREDGKTHFDNVIVPIDLFDVITLKKSSVMQLRTDKDYLPLDKRNTVYKAVSAMKRAYDISDNFNIKIIKNIPAQSGLGGGSADAAAIINMLDEMYSLQMSRESKIDIARTIDEDTPFCLFNEPARVQGIGDVVTPIALKQKLYYLVIKPAFGISTKRFLNKFKDHSDEVHNIERMLHACELGEYDSIMNARYNALQSTVIDHYPKVSRIIKSLEACGLDGVCMSGSGTSIVGFGKDIATVRKAYEELALKYPFAKYGVINAQDVIK